jgi:hypothetical protein
MNWKAELDALIEETMAMAKTVNTIKPKSYGSSSSEQP